MLRTLKRVGFVVVISVAICGGIVALAAVVMSPLFAVKLFLGETALNWVMGGIFAAAMLWVFGGAAIDLWGQSGRVFPKAKRSTPADADKDAGVAG